MSTVNATTSAAGKRKILVVVSSFPNRIQPWVLNWVEQICLHDGDPYICAEGRLGGTYPRKVDDLGLLAKTRYLNLNGIAHAAKSFAPVLNPFSVVGREIVRGWARIARDSTRHGVPFAQACKRLAIAPAAGLDRVDLIHSHVIPEAHRFLPLIRIHGAPLVVTFHGLPPKGVPFLPMEKREKVFEQASLFLVNTKFAQRQLESLGCPSEKIAILPQGLRLEEFPFKPAALPGNGKVQILTVGRLHPDKGHEYAIRGVAALLQKGYDLHYEIIGTGPERARLERLCADLGVAQQVTFRGEADDDTLRRAYQSAHIFILPSLRDQDGYHEETQGVVIQEAQASGAIVIATRTGGIPECVDDGRSAFLVDDRDAHQIAECVRRVLQAQDAWPDWRAAARRWVEERYDTDVLGNKLWQIYDDVLNTFHRRTERHQPEREQGLTERAVR